MTRLEAFLFLKRNVRDRSAVKRSLAAEALMEKLAERLCGDQEIWSLAGLLHNVDHDLTVHNPRRQGLVAAEILQAEGFSAELIQAIRHHRLPPDPADLLTRALAAAVPAARLVFEGAADRAELEQTQADGLLTWVDDSSVVPEANRLRIRSLEPDGVQLVDLLRLAREAALQIADDLF